MRDPRTPRRASAPVTTLTKAVDPEKLRIAQEAAREQMDVGGVFSPGMPLTPFDGVSGIPRAWNFPTGYNLKSRADRDGRLTFALLKTLTDSYDVAGMCINHRIDDVRSLSWTVRAADWVETDDQGSVAKARAALKRPDGVHPFRSWLAMFLQDILRYDAGCLYRRRNMLGEVIGLEVVSGTTIAPLQDDDGRPPAAPAPAYVQYISGTPWEWLTRDDLIYEPFRPQADSPYGIAPLESVLLTVNTDMRFQQHWMNWFTEGNIPEGFATAPAEITTPEQLEKWEAYWESMNTDDRVKHKLKMIPHGTILDFPKEKEFDPTFPMFLMRKVCAAFHVTPNDLGFTEDVNRATGDTQVDVQFRIGTLPLIRHIEGILTDYLQDDLGLPVVFEFDTGQEKEDRLETAKADEVYIKNGVVSPDEVRERIYGLPTDAARPVPRYIYSTTQGPIPLRSLLDVAGPVDPQTAAPTEAVPLDTTAFSGTPGVLPHKSPGSPQFARAPIDPDEPARPQMEQEVPGSGIVAPPPTEDDPTTPAVKSLQLGDVAEVRKELAKWRANTLTRMTRGQRPRLFQPEAMPLHLVEAVWKTLQHARTTAQADAVFTMVRKATLDNEDIEQATFEAEAGEDYDSDPGETLQEAEESDMLSLEVGSEAPKAKGWRAQSDQPTPQQQVDLKLTDYWKEQIAGGLGALWSLDEIRDTAHRALSAYTGEEVDHVGQLFERAQLARTMRDQRIKQVLDGLWSDAYGVGQLAAQVSIHGPDDDFTNWQPGQATQALSLSDLGWLQAIQSKGLALKGITDTTLDRIGNAIDEGVQKGWSVDQLAKHLSDVITDPNRAEMIAHTESARMLTIASMSAYREAGLAQWYLVTSEGACEECDAIEFNNPHSVFDDAEQPPIHPRCRCSVAPSITPATGDTSDDNTASADSSDELQLEDATL